MDNNDNGNENIKKRKSGTMSEIDKLTEFAEKNVQIANDGKHGYVRIQIDGHYENHKVNSDMFKNYIRYMYINEYDRPPSDKAVKQFIETTNAKAIFKYKPMPFFHRLAESGGSIYIDRGDRDWTAIEINPGLQEGWQVVTNPSVNFVRKSAINEIPIPEPGGDIEELRDFITCDYDSFLILVAWMIGALNPGISCPILQINGEPGSAKTYSSWIIQSLVDPVEKELGNIPPSERELFISCNNSWMQGYDNVSGLNRKMSDAFCKIVTGGTYSTRKLYSDDEEVTFKARRPVLINGINFAGSLPDFVSRSIVVRLPIILPEQRMLESELNKKFHDARPRLLGCIYKAVAGALKYRNSVYLRKYSRMADFERFVTAAESSLGFKQYSFSKVYKRNRSSSTEGSLDANVVARAIMVLMEGRSEWQGLAHELLSEINSLPSVTEDMKQSGYWPKADNALTRRMNEFGGQLREHKSIDYRSKRTSKGAHITLRNTDVVQAAPDLSELDLPVEVEAEFDF